MQPDDKHLARELLTIGKMVGIYCADHHDTSADVLCESCQEFMDYAEVRLEKCPYGEDKPTCANCPIHCYRPEPRERMREVMRFSGPRMLKRQPVLAILHMIDDRRPVPPLPDRSRVRSRSGSDTADG